MNQRVSASTLKERYDHLWALMPRDMKMKSISQLRKTYDPYFFDAIRNMIDDKGLVDWTPNAWHMSQGKDICECLRKVIRDKDLPYLTESPSGQPYPHPVQAVWNDYFLVVLEATVGRRRV